MSNDMDHHHPGELSEAAIALFLMDNDGNELTDILVAALNDAFRILDNEIAVDRIH